MPRRKRAKTTTAVDTCPTRPTPKPTNLTDDHVVRWAELIADGRHSFPTGLSMVDRERMLVAVRQRLRRRFFLYIAKALAAWIHHGQKPSTDTVSVESKDS